MKKPAISVLMPARNAAPFLEASVGSILGQSYGDLELLAVDDASTDDTHGVLRRLAARDKRLRVWRNRKNLGQALTSNFMLTKARGRYIARMDADDVSHLDRFAKQVAAMEADPALGLLSSSMWLWDGQRRKKLSRSPLGHEDIRTTMLFQNAVANPPVLMRRSALGSLRYRPGYYATEDYELWCRLILKHKFGNLAEPVLDYRVHAQQSGPSRAMDQYEAATRVRWDYLKALGFRLDVEQRQLHAALCPPFLRRRQDWLPGVRAWLLELLAQNTRLRRFEEPRLLALAQERFALYCLGLGLKGWRYYHAQGGILRSKHAHSRASLKALLKHHLKPEPDRWA